MGGGRGGHEVQFNRDLPAFSAVVPDAAHKKQLQSGAYGYNASQARFRLTPSANEMDQSYGIKY